MRKIATPALVAVMLLASSSAWAMYDVTEKIREINPAKHEIRLADGFYYVFLPEVSLDGFKVGDLVTITCHQYNNNIGVLAYAERIVKVKSAR